ncbi:MAG TPA: response regulator [Bryobacteraceae bacterium]|nr:response regulator [Bryobacteraceae bacterium]
MILIVDDDPTFLEDARQILNRDRQVFFASDSKRAVALAGDLGFSVVLVNLDLRYEDGLVLIRDLRTRFSGLPIIAMTASRHHTLIELAKEFGAIEILRKPITPEWKPIVERARAMSARA